MVFPVSYYEKKTHKDPQEFLIIAKGKIKESPSALQISPLDMTLQLHSQATLILSLYS